MSFQRILIALDRSAIAAHATEVGVDLAKALGAQIALVHVVDTKLASPPEGGLPPSVLLGELRQEGRRFLKAASLRIGDPPPREYLAEGNPRKEIIKTAEEWKADLIVMGTHGRSGISRVLLGSTAEGVVRQAQIPVLTVRAASQ